ncbi:copper resistance protein CopC [Micromonospora sp. DSM 115977]|uniref:Copper resistance protein CopC n=1 Tax=Micromonospora reichwaldensis TaxID=3075516 RepID=A0ABU2WSA8_9ACTN|nr:copper resistance protein CopC [Micromonospora sp. DSM 115977]MDT0528266.1 copper resistance protein CopC [Micromonospora sp. DSM 115977]
MHNPSRRPTLAALVAAALAAAALLLVPAAPAAAHNTLRAASPADGDRLTTPPTRVTLEFAQRLDPTFTTIALTDATRRKIPTGGPTVDGTKGTVTVDETLGEGTYTVAYRIVSADGHPVQGSYRFTVASGGDTAGGATTATGAVTDPPAATPTAVAAPSAATAPPAAGSVGPAAASGSGGLGTGGVLLAAGVLVAALGGTALLLRRRRETR